MSEDFALSSSYFAGHHLSPTEMAKQTKALGFTRVELGYYTRESDLDEWQEALAANQLHADSLHAFCPLPVECPQLGPEVFSLADTTIFEREQAVTAMHRTLACATRFGARVVVVHGGRVPLYRKKFFGRRESYRSRLSQAFQANPNYLDVVLVDEERAMREQSAPALMQALSQSLATLLPEFERAGVTLAFENLPGIEAFPDPAELAYLRQQFHSPALAAWYDIGHGELKDRVGDWPVSETLALTLPFTAGMHIHDVAGTLQDHCAPGEGNVDYTALLPLLKKPGLLHVFEPAPSVSPEALMRGLSLIRGLLEA